MDRRYFIANWKSHFTTAEAGVFLESLKGRIGEINSERDVIILCPSFTLLDYCSRKIKELNLPICLGAQNNSSNEDGAFTGEVSARQIKEFVSYVIIGHSERRRDQHETDDDVRSKIDQAKRVGLSVIQCIQEENSFVSEEADIVAFEPPSAISTFGTGVPDNPVEVERVLSVVGDRVNGKTLIYGGSVNPETIKGYADIAHCSGFLVGSASLDASTFLSLPLSC